MIMRGLISKIVMIAVLLICSILSICILFSSNLELAFLTAEVGQVKREVELETNITIPAVNNTKALVKKKNNTNSNTFKLHSTFQTPKNVSSLKPPKYLKFVLITTAFRKTILREEGYWNLKQHDLILKLNVQKKLKKKLSDWKEEDVMPCNKTSLEELRVNIHDYDCYPNLLRKFMLTMNCRDPPILIDQPNKCPWKESERQPFLLFALKSSPINFEQRQAVRVTWGQEGMLDGGLMVRTVFLLGTMSWAATELQERVRYEALRYGDILQWDFEDSFFNLTLKDNAFLGWAQQRCPGTSFIFKGDDDVFVNRWAMVEFLRSLEPEKANTLYTGALIFKATPIRKPTSKYYIPYSFYNGFYPPYAGGGGYIFSGALITRLFHVSRHIALHPIDDVYTGMCFQAMGIIPTMHPGIKTFDISPEARMDVCEHKKLLLVHQRSPQEILRLWTEMVNPNVKC